MFQIFFLPLVITAALAQEGTATELEGTEPTSESVEVSTQTFEVSADLRGEYLLGQPIVITITARNTSTASANFPNLSSRPWLVRFKLEAADNHGSNSQAQTRFTTPPETDPMGHWSIPPRGMRTVDIEIPSGNGLSRGDYNLSIEVDGEAGLFEVDTRKISIAPPSPVADHLPSEVMGIERTGLHASWLHQAAEGYDLYMHSVSGEEVNGDSFNTHIAHLTEAVEPKLSRSLPAQSLSRYVYWRDGERGIGFVENSGESQNRVDIVELPYPQFEFLSRGVTTPSGDLLVPIWIPSPSGITGEVRVAEIHNGQIQAISSVSRMRSKPAWTESGVDNSGALRLLLGHGEGVDLYTLSGTSGLPARGTRVIQGAGSAVRGAFGISTHEDHQGLSIITAKISTAEEDDVGVNGETAIEQIATKWWTLNGDLIYTPSPVGLTGEQNIIEQLLPGPSGAWALIYSNESRGDAFADQQGRSGSISDTESLIWDSEGGLWVRSVSGSSPVSARIAN